MLVWAAIATFIAVPIAAAATSPLLGYRDAVYILGGFAGIVAMSLLLVQPLLAGGLLPGLSGVRGRRVHRWTGGVLVMAVVIHIAALWITSPPDVIDALLLASPTPFSVWGVTAMWAVFASALLAALRRRFRLRPLAWRRAHTALAAVIVLGSVMHAMLIQGTMETMSKAALCVVVLAATAKVIADKGGAPRRPR
ncbi:ferric reductase-like transmembrane domain-containing protein [uncultured Paracoccus sp.]|uniref:ferric reductase-like transmembrane domain-containing protein n=1 Tax=uncultured Paracoccus sp. TaxID=189685 RepID=UPI00260E003C|nr:ferric reductase-like transmembrane domain-containing protein [uncultured Paracoccus sp.]